MNIKKRIMLLNILVILGLTSILLIVNNSMSRSVKPTYSAYAAGDVVPDGVIDLTDVGRLYRGMKGIVTLSSDAKIAGDVVADGTIDLSDVGRLYRYYMKQINNLVVVSKPEIYTSDNIKSGNTHSIGFLLKLKSGADVYYCEDTGNTCNPSTKYTGELRYASSTTKYLRYKACSGGNSCSSVGSYKIVLSIDNKLGSNSSSQALAYANPWGASYYSQGDSRWGSTAIPVSPYQTIRAAGCGYTSLAMLMTGITHNYSITPVTILNDLKATGKKYSYSNSECNNCGGYMYYYAIYNESLTSKYNYGTSELFNYFTAGCVNKDCLNVSGKKDSIMESLKMGHMIIALAPSHYIALISIDSDDKILIYNPDSSEYMGKASISDVWDTFWDYKSRCSKGSNLGDCGLTIAYEVYPKGGMSLAYWKKIGN